MSPAPPPTPAAAAPSGPWGLRALCVGWSHFALGAGERTDTWNRGVTHSRRRSGAVLVWASPLWLPLLLRGVCCARGSQISRRRMCAAREGGASGPGLWE